MTTEATPAPVAQATTDPPVPAPAQPTASQATPAQATPAQASGARVELSSDALKQRLADERKAAERQLLAKWGAEKPEDLDAKLKKLSELETAQLSEKERAEKLIAELTKQAESGNRNTAIAVDAVQELFDALPETAKVAIDELQPASPAERLKFIRAFRKLAPVTSASAGASSASTVTAAPAPPAPVPASTSSGAPAPKPGGKTPYQEYEDLKAHKPQAAGFFYQANRAAIEASRPTG